MTETPVRGAARSQQQPRWSEAKAELILADFEIAHVDQRASAFAQIVMWSFPLSTKIDRLRIACSIHQTDGVVNVSTESGEGSLTGA